MLLKLVSSKDWDWQRSVECGECHREVRGLALWPGLPPAWPAGRFLEIKYRIVFLLYGSLTRSEEYTGVHVTVHTVQGFSGNVRRAPIVRQLWTMSMLPSLLTFLERSKETLNQLIFAALYLQILFSWLNFENRPNVKSGRKVQIWDAFHLKCTLLTS